MPIPLSTAYDALVIVLDERENRDISFFKEEMRHMFEKRKVIYYEKCEMGAKELYQDVSQKIERGEVIFPASQRIVFCNYLDLNDLDEEWLKKYRERMKYFKNMVMASPTQHYHFTFFRYRTSRPLGEKKEEIFRVLNQFWETEHQHTRHTEFLVCTTGLGSTLKSQEKGIVRLLRILSGSDYGKVFRVDDFRYGLYVLNENEYYENAARICAEELGVVQRWLQIKRDVGLNRFFNGIMENVLVQMAKYQKEMKQFEDMAGMYPVSISEYVSHGWGPRRRYLRPSGVHPVLQKEKEARQRSFMESLKTCQEKEEWKQNALEGMNYPDLDELLQARTAGTVWLRIHQMIESAAENKNLNIEDKERFEESFRVWVEELFDAEITEPVLRKRREEAQDKAAALTNEQDVAAKYGSLRECFASIGQDTRYQAPDTIPASDVGKFAVINGSLGDAWAVNGYSVEGLSDEQIVVQNDIQPYEILFMKLGKYVSLDPENPADSIEALNMVLF